nr:reverse transcriptase domain-containing protein [Tanacetum cinerariifolium]
MPLSIWEKLSLLELTPTRMILELTNRSTTRPAGIAKDVFVKVGKFYFLTDFIVVDYVVDPQVPLILGRPVLRTGQALNDVYDDDYYDTEGDILYLEKLPNEDPSSNLPSVKNEDLKQVDTTMTKPLIEEPPELELKELPSHLEYAWEQQRAHQLELEFGLPEVGCFRYSVAPITTQSGVSYDRPPIPPPFFSPQGGETGTQCDKGYVQPSTENIQPPVVQTQVLIDEPVVAPKPKSTIVKNEDLKQVDTTMTKPLIEEPPELELKELPSHLEYAFLEGTNKLPIIIFKELKDE